MKNAGRILAMLIWVASVLVAVAQAGSNYTWNVASGNWGTAGSWNPAGPPTAADTATFSIANTWKTVTLDNDYAITDVNISGWGADGGLIWDPLVTTKTLSVSGALTYASTFANSTFPAILGSGGNGTLNVSVSISKSLTLTNPANNYGATNVTDGTLWAAADGCLGAGTVNVGANGTFGVKANLTAANSPTIQFDGGTLAIFNDSGFSCGAPIDLHSGTISLTNNSSNFTISGLISGAGKLRFGAAREISLTGTNNTYSGGTDVMSNTLNVKAAGALGQGVVNVYAGRLYTNPAAGTGAAVLNGPSAINLVGGTLQLASTETRPLVATIREGGALWYAGGTTGLNYTPATGNFQVYNGAIFDRATFITVAHTLPTLAQIQQGDVPVPQPQIYQGLRANTDLSTVVDPTRVGAIWYLGPGAGGNGGGAGTILWGGLATVDTSFSITGGAIKEYTLGGGFTLYSQTLQTITVNALANALDATGPINLSGNGKFVFSGASIRDQAGTIEKNGVGSLQFVLAGGLPASKTLNVNGGYLDVNAVDALAAGSITNLNPGGCFTVDQNLTTGTINVNAGGGIRYTANTQFASVVPTFATGSHLILGGAIAPPAAVNGNVNYIMAVSASTTYGAFFLSDSTRITSPGGASASIAAASGEIQTSGTQGRLAAPTGYTLTVGNKVNFVGKTLIVGDASNFNTFNAAGTAYGAISQGGTVQLSNTTNAIGSIDIQAGTLQVGALTHLGGARAFKLGTSSAVPGTLWLNYAAPALAATPPAGAFSGWGTVKVGASGTDTLTLNGYSLSPGNSAGKLTVQGNLTFAAAALSTLEIEIMGEGNQPGIDYDQLSVSGTLTGINNVTLTVGGAAGLDLTGQTFDIVTYNLLSGTALFSAVIFDPGWSGQIEYQSKKIVLYNVVGPAAAGGTVPEPAALGLLGLTLLAIRRRRS